jgi:hypothetical protein
VRRSLVPVLMLIATISPPLRAQSVLAIGFASTLGSNWQIEAADIGFTRRVGLGPVGALGASLRVGWFGDQAAIIGGTRGFIGGATLSARSARLNVADIGQELNPTQIGVDVTFEVAGYLASNSPIPEGSRWASVAVLPGFWVGQSGGSQFGVLIGPAWFAGDVRRTHAFLGVRVEVPLARRRGGP